MKARSWSAIAADRPVATWMATVAIAVFGLVSLGQLPLALLPDLSYPTITVRTTFDGAAPEEVEQAVTDPIEKVVGTVENVVGVQSVSRPGVSDVTLKFRWGTRLDLASQRVRERLDVLELDSAAGKPSLLRYDPALDPVLRVAISGDQPATELARYAKEFIEPELQRVAGVASVRTRGSRDELIRVALDRDRLSAAGVQISEVETALRSQTINVAGGQLRNEGVDYLVRSVNEVTSASELANLPLRSGSATVRIGDVATITRELRPVEVITRLDGSPAVEVSVFKDGDANLVSVSNAVHQRLFGNLPGVGVKAADGSGDAERATTLQDEAPAGVKLRIVGDQAVFVRASIKEVTDAAVMGSFWAIVVIFLFLRSGLSTVAVGLAIPISALVTFAGMKMLDISLNIMSLGGLALGTGMVVDDAIVVLESIARRQALGDSPRTAAIRGAEEVGAAVFASTMTTVAVFAPLGFIEGVAGQIFGDLAWTVVISLTASLIFSLVFVPMFAATVGRGMLGQFTQQLAADEGLALAANEEAPKAAVPLSDRLRGAFSLSPVLSAWNSAATEWRAFGALPPGPLRTILRLASPLLFPLALLRLTVGLVFGLLLSLLGALVAIVGGLLVALWWLVSRAMGLLLRPFTYLFHRGYDAAAAGYRILLAASLRQPAAVFAIAALLAATGLWAGSGLGLSLLPEMRQGVLAVDIELPAGTPIESTAERTAALEARLLRSPAIAGVGTSIGAASDDTNLQDRGPHRAALLVEAAPQPSLERAEKAAEAAIRKAVAQVDDLRVGEIRPPSLLAFEAPMIIEVTGRRLDALARSAQTLAAAVETKAPGARVDAPAREGLPEIRVRFDRERLAAYGIDPRSAAESIRRSVQGVVAAEVRETDRSTDVLVQVNPDQLSRIEDLRALPLRVENTGGGLSLPQGGIQALLRGLTGLGASGPTPSAAPDANAASPRSIPLGAVAEVELGKGPVEVQHSDGERVIRLPVDGDWRSLGELRERLASILRTTPLEPGVTARLRGQSAELDGATRSIIFAMLLALFLVYAVMAATFESFVGPLIIMLTIPLAGVSVAYTLRLLDEPVSAVVGLGAIILAGIVVKNAIVLLDAVSLLRSRGMERTQAVQEACQIRLRPVVMTALTTIVGVIPMMVAQGAGAEIRQPLGWVLGAGLAGSTLLTLVIIPVVYDRVTAWRESGAAGPVAPEEPDFADPSPS
jgi:HAE1 family hydrophobic/amphiphilic exporter-1